MKLTFELNELLSEFAGFHGDHVGALGAIFVVYWHLYDFTHLKYLKLSFKVLHLNQLKVDELRNKTSHQCN
jgi:hypothetical protein